MAETANEMGDDPGADPAPRATFEDLATEPAIPAELTRYGDEVPEGWFEGRR